MKYRVRLVRVRVYSTYRIIVTLIATITADAIIRAILVTVIAIGSVALGTAITP
jgi:hypothetical protein